MSTLIRIQKINCGVQLVAVKKDGQPVSRSTSTIVRALKNALDWYIREVVAAFEKLGMKGCGYEADLVHRTYPQPLCLDVPHRGRKAFSQSPKKDIYGYQLNLEPWGFALVDENGEPTMNDTGSSYTPGRAKALQAYQAPLKKVKVNEQSVRFETIREIHEF